MTYCPSQSRRAEYDATCRKKVPQPVSLSTSIDFMDDLEGELNRQLVLLALLYIQRRRSRRPSERLSRAKLNIYLL
jgi:hypothetical protein